jgi:hypothetical protein
LDDLSCFGSEMSEYRALGSYAIAISKAVMFL